VCDAVARGHGIHAFWLHHSFESKAVVVHNFTVEKPSNGLRSDMRRHVDRLLVAERHQPESVQKAPRPDHAAILYRQGAVTGSVPSFTSFIGED
jgi:hypothetical protein